MCHNTVIKLDVLGTFENFIYETILSCRVGIA